MKYREPMKGTSREVYLGDGVYCFDDVNSDQITLYTQRMTGIHTVILDDEVIGNFLKFVADKFELNIVSRKVK